MGNQAGKPNGPRESLRRRGGLLNRSGDDEPSAYPSRKIYSTINQSLEVPSSAEPRQQYHSIDYSQSGNEDVKSIRSDRRKTKQEMERDQILQKLSQKNEELRRQLKQISEELTEQLKRKKFVPKKKGAGGDQDDNQQAKGANNAGVRRQLQNGYRQIEMYKRTIEALKGKQQNNESDNRLRRLENQVATVDSQINEYMKKVEGLKKIKKGQDKVIEKDINEDLIGGVAAFKKEAEDIKNNLKEMAKRERQRDSNYKRQQAYLFEVERKWREMNGDYFPELKKKAAVPYPIFSRVENTGPKDHSGVNPKQFAEVMQELNLLKSKHDDYHKKIDAIILQKNKISDEQSVLDENIRYSDKVIEALKLKLIQIKKIVRPTKKSLFGYDNYEGTELQSEYNGGGVSEIQKEIQEQVNQDQFDIKHLIANIPKPSRPKVVIEFQENAKPDPKKKQPQVAREMSSQGGMIISGEKSEPKKWGSALTRTEEKGRQIRRESVFEDTSQFTAEAKPLIIGINVWVNKNNAIMGLQAIYLNNDEIRYGTKSSAAADGFLQRYDLQSPDYLKNVTGALSQQGYLEYLVLYSKQGKIGTFGFKNEGQEQFNYGLASTQRPFRIYGASFVFDSQPRVNRLGLQICQE